MREERVGGDKEGKERRSTLISLQLALPILHATNEAGVQSGASYLSQDFVMFFHVSGEGLPGQ